MALTLWHKFAELVTQIVLGYDYKLTPQQFFTLFFFIMSKNVILSLLAQGNTGDEILSILDAIVSEQSAEVNNNEPTADMIEFWSLTGTGS